MVEVGRELRTPEREAIVFRSDRGRLRRERTAEGRRLISFGRRLFARCSGGASRGRKNFGGIVWLHIPRVAIISARRWRTTHFASLSRAGGPMIWRLLVARRNGASAHGRWRSILLAVDAPADAIICATGVHNDRELEFIADRRVLKGIGVAARFQQI
jgi:hypothetical protein